MGSQVDDLNGCFEMEERWRRDRLNRRENRKKNREVNEGGPKDKQKDRDTV